MKKVLLAAFAGVCVMTSIMATSAPSGNYSNSKKAQQAIRDTVPSKKGDTSRSPKPDTTKIVDLELR
jgi:hypothetical protein